MDKEKPKGSFLKDNLLIIITGLLIGAAAVVLQKDEALNAQYR